MGSGDSPAPGLGWLKAGWFLLTRLLLANA